LQSEATLNRTDRTFYYNRDTRNKLMFVVQATINLFTMMMMITMMRKI